MISSKEMNKIKVLSKQLTEIKYNKMKPEFPFLTKNRTEWEKEYSFKIRPARKWIKLDEGKSGRFVIDKNTGDIFGIKAYGVPHLGRYYGNISSITSQELGQYIY